MFGYNYYFFFTYTGRRKKDFFRCKKSILKLVAKRIYISCREFFGVFAVRLLIGVCSQEITYSIP